MEPAKVMKIASDLKGMTVLEASSGARLGEVSDALVSPAEGKLLGVIVRTQENVSRVLVSDDFHIGRDAVMAATAGALRQLDIARDVPNGLPAANLTRVKAVTGDGRRLGIVSDVYLIPETREIFYRITESAIQRFTGGGFYLFGDIPSAFSPDGVRMIVPNDTEDRHAARSLDELLELRAGAAPQGREP